MWPQTTEALNNAMSNSASLNEEYIGDEPDFDLALLGEIEIGLNTQRTVFRNQIPEIKQALRPMFAKMQKNKDDRLGSSAVRYVLHRLFMQVGWSVHGLEPAGEALNTGSPIKILQGHLPEFVRNLLDARLDGQGLDLNEVAILAAAFKHVAHNEMKERLRAAYRANNLPPNLRKMKQEQGQQILDVYMSNIILGENFSAMNPPEVLQLAQRMDGAYPLWAEIRKKVQNLQQNVIRMDFSNLKHVVEEIGDRFAFWNNAQCLKKKHELVAYEDQDSGRVRLSEFYRVSHYKGKHNFGDDTQYLRQLGVLDDTNPSDPRVIIPNWINSKSNCIGSSTYYSICCINECDGLIAKIESELQGPYATPIEIATLIAALQSNTTLENRTLPASLIRRLNDVADKHDGLIPIHGVPFLQVMHFAYPRECPFLHVSSTTKAQQTEDLKSSIGNIVQAKIPEIMQHIEHRSSDEMGECVPWKEEEKICDPLEQAVHKPVSERSSIPMTWVVFNCAVILAAFTSGIVKFAKSSSIICTGKNHGQKPVYYL